MTSEGVTPRCDRPAPERTGGWEDCVQPFQIDSMNVRGRSVRLGGVADRIVTAHGYPPPLAGLVGEFLALTALLGSILKSGGLLTVQAKAARRAPVNFIVADFAHGGNLRGYGDVDADALDKLPADAGFRALLGEGGTLALTIEQGQARERYQGIVELSGERLSDCAAGYFERSEQTPTTLRLACRQDGESGLWRAGGIMIQHLAGATRERPDRHRHLGVIDSTEEENWTRASTLMNSVRTEELLDPGLELNALLYRLFHEEGVRVFQPLALAHRCRCSEERTRRLLLQFDKDELAGMIVDGEIVATCQFCGTAYRFRPEDIGAG